MLMMIDRGIRHVPVVSGGGELLGVVTDIDLLADETQTPIMLRRAIADATDAAGAAPTGRPAARDPDRDARRGRRRRTDRRRCCRWSSTRWCARLIELTVAELGPPPAEFGWLSLGSFGRREAVPSLGRRLGDGLGRRAPAATPPRLHAPARPLGRRRARCDGLAGGPPRGRRDRRDVGELDRRLAARRSASGWTRPISEPELVAISIVLDARDDLRARWRPRRAGAAARGPAPPRAAAPAAAPGAERASRRPASCATSSSSTPGEHAGQFDIKHGGLLPIVNIARYAGLAAGRDDHLDDRAPAGRRRGREADARPTRRHSRRRSSCSRSCGSTTRSRQLEAGEPPDDQIDPKTLNPLTRRYLRDAFRAVASVQRSLDTKLAWRHDRAGRRAGPVEPARYLQPRCPRPRTPWRRGRLCVLDLETTGLDAPRRRDRRLRTMPIDGGRARVRGARSRLVRPRRMPGRRDDPHPRAAQGGPRRRARR